jgi:hypothetical protein
VRTTVFAGLALLVIGSIMACTTTLPSRPATQPETQPPDTVETQQPAEVPPLEATIAEDGWSMVQSFSGKESTVTAAFRVSGSKWRIIWTVDPEIPQYSAFEILVYRQNGSDMLLNRISYSLGMESGTANINEGGDDYYLKIICANLNRWSIDIEDDGSQIPDQQVKITDIHYRGMDYYATIASGHSIVEWDEYVEIKNLSDSPQNIVGWKLKNITKGGPTFTFPLFKPCSCEYLGSWSKCVEQCYPKHPCTIEPRHSIRVFTGKPEWQSGGYCFYYYP